MKDWTTFNFALALLGWFIAFLIHQEYNLPYRIKKLLRIVPTNYIKVIDCFPCFAFWVTLLITAQPITAIAVYAFAITTERQ